MKLKFSSTHKNILYRAKSAGLARDYDLAIRLLKRLTQEFPDEMGLQQELAATYIRSGNDEQALSLYQKILQNDRNDFGALIAIGGIYRRLRKYEESVSVLERALALDGNSVQTYYTLGFTYKQMGRFDDALECFDQVISQDPGDILAYNHLGSIYSMRGDSKNAIAAYQRGLQLDANHPIIHYNLAQEYENLGYFDEVMEEYEATLRAKPGWSEAVNGYALFLMSHNLNKEAYNILSQGIEVTPENLDLQCSMGMVQLKRNEYQDAGRRFEVVLEQDEDDLRAIMGLADVYIQQGRNDDSLDLLQKVGPVQEKSKGIQLQFVRSLLNANQFHEAGDLIKEMAQEYLFDVSVLHILSEYFACCDDQEQLQQTLDKLHELDHSYFLHFLDIALRFRQIGNFEKAQTYLVEYLQHLPNDPVALSALASCYEESSQYGDAMRFYQQALNCDTDNSYLQKAVERISVFAQADDESEGGYLEARESSLGDSPLNDIYDDKLKVKNSVFEQKNFLGEFKQLIDEEHYREESTDSLLLQPRKITRKKRSLEYYDPLKIATTDFEGLSRKDDLYHQETPHLESLTHDDGPVDYEPLFSPDGELQFQDEEDEIFDSVNQKPEEIFLREEMPQFAPAPEFYEPRPTMPRQIYPQNYPQNYPESWQPLYPSNNVAMPRDFTNDSLRMEEENIPFAESIEEIDEDLVPLEELQGEFPLEEEPLEEVYEEDASLEELSPCEDEELLEEELPQELESLQEAEPVEELDAFQEVEPVEELESFEETESSQNVSQEIGSLMNNLSQPEDNAHLVALFQALKGLCQYLPQEEKADFNASMKPLQMEYIISRLAGKPGLMAMAENIREQGLVEVPVERYDIVKRFHETTASARVMNVMRSLVQQLPDKEKSFYLDDSLQHLLNRLSEI